MTLGPKPVPNTLRATVPLEDLCYFHGVEVEIPGDHRACLECGHIYRTESELIDADYKAQKETAEFFRSDQAVMSAADRAAWETAEPVMRTSQEIHVCPLCTHDF